MNKILLAIIIFAMSIFFVACNNSTKNEITLEKAKDIVLKDSNLQNNQVDFVKAEKSMDDGIKKYDIEFYHNDKEYDYEVDAMTGEILEYDNEVEDYNIVQPYVSEENKDTISIEKAKEIALKNADLQSEQVEFIKELKSTDDGVDKYDIEFYHNNIKYDYEIDANTGSIIKYEKEN